VGGGAGVTHYKGDLNPSFRPFLFSAGANLFGRYNFSNSLSVKAGVMGGWLRGDDRKSGYRLNEARGYRFKGSLVEYSGQLEYNFMNFRSSNRSSSAWTPYLFGGIAGYLTPNQTFKEPLGIALEPLKGLSPLISVPFGVGFKKIWKSQWNFGFEFGARLLVDPRYSDQLDQFSFKKGTNHYLDTDPSAPAAPPHFIVANTPQADKYFYTNFYISYVFYKAYCPPGR